MVCGQNEQPGVGTSSYQYLWYGKNLPFSGGTTLVLNNAGSMYRQDLPTVQSQASLPSLVSLARLCTLGYSSQQPDLDIPETDKEVVQTQSWISPLYKFSGLKMLTGLWGEFSTRRELYIAGHSPQYIFCDLRISNRAVSRFKEEQVLYNCNKT